MVISMTRLAVKLLAYSKKAPNKFLFSLCGLLSLVACNPINTVYTDEQRTTAPYNEVPVSSNFQTTTQLKLQAAQHWAKIADETGKAISSMLIKGSVCIPSKNKCKSVFINPPQYVTEFSRIFHSQLLTTMVASGIVVSTDLYSSIAIHIDVQPIFFAANRPQYRYAGHAAELGPGIWALQDVSLMSPENPNNAPPVKDALHWFRTEFASGATPQMEIVVTVSAIDESRYLARTTNIYYVTDGDRRLYNQEICSVIQPCPTTPTVVSVPNSPPPKPIRSIPIRSIDITGDCPLDAECCPAIRPCPQIEVKPKPTKKKT